jgi:Ni/Co efflux regulator RcnB
MKRIFLTLALLAVMLSPMMVSQANAAPVKHHRLVKHHRKLVKKHSAKRLAARKHHRKANA